MNEAINEKSFHFRKSKWYFAGISLIVEAVMDIASMFINGKEPIPQPVIINEEGENTYETQA